MPPPSTAAPRPRRRLQMQSTRWCASGIAAARAPTSCAGTSRRACGGWPTTCSPPGAAASSRTRWASARPRRPSPSWTTCSARSACQRPAHPRRAALRRWRPAAAPRWWWCRCPLWSTGSVRPRAGYPARTSCATSDPRTRAPSSDATNSCTMTTTTTSTTTTRLKWRRWTLSWRRVPQQGTTATEATAMEMEITLPRLRRASLPPPPPPPPRCVTKPTWF
mmetsp:Transcript_16757/g.41144  ORF Transcript_16757/g.41144 Transcript_16757/m.41144 type:complete len:221 (-) Transcript_16757:221-883(-)